MNSQVPGSLLHPGLVPVWQAARGRLDRFGSQRRGRIALPKLDQQSILALESLIGRKLGKLLDLADLEASLVERKIGSDLCDALTRLRHPPSQEAARRRAGRARSQAAREALTRAVSPWTEPWAAAWAESVVSAGLLANLDSRAVETLMDDVRRLLDHLDRAERPSISRTELAAVLYGSAHALDQGEKRAAFAAHALRHMLSVKPDDSTGRADGDAEQQQSAGVSTTAAPGQPEADADALSQSAAAEDRTAAAAAMPVLGQRELWEAVGVLPDRVSAPVLTWRLPVVGGSPLDKQIGAASAGSLPVHVSLFALLRYPVAVPPLTPVLVVENPRLVEAAAERSLPIGVVTSNGNPSTAVTVLLEQLLRSGASVWYHGDFDAPGIGICRRMHENGCKPWMMDAVDYKNTVRLAQRTGAQLAVDTSGDCGTTPWDPSLREAFNSRRLIVHEESVIDSVLNGFLSRSQ